MHKAAAVRSIHSALQAYLFYITHRVMVEVIAAMNRGMPCSHHDVVMLSVWYCVRHQGILEREWWHWNLLRPVMGWRREFCTFHFSVVVDWILWCEETALHAEKERLGDCAKGTKYRLEMGRLPAVF